MPSFAWRHPLAVHFALTFAISWGGVLHRATFRDSMGDANAMRRAFSRRLPAVPDNATPPETFFGVFGPLSHLYLTPVLVTPIEGRVPDYLDAGPLRASELPRGPGCTH